MKKLVISLAVVSMLTLILSPVFAFNWPTSGRAGGDWGDPRPGGRIHKGVDIYNRIGTGIGASAAGRIAYAAYGWNGAYGNVVYCNHTNSYQTRYAHLSRILCRRGQSVKSNQTIAALGRSAISSSPAHLHFEILRAGVKKPIYVRRGIWLTRGRHIPGW